MNVDVLNGYVLGVIVLIAFCLFVTMVAAGFAEFTSRLPKVPTRKKRGRNQSASRR